MKFYLFRYVPTSGVFSLRCATDSSVDEILAVVMSLSRKVHCEIQELYSAGRTLAVVTAAVWSLRFVDRRGAGTTV